MEDGGWWMEDGGWRMEDGGSPSQSQPNSQVAPSAVPTPNSETRRGSLEIRSSKNDCGTIGEEYSRYKIV